jgi:hypothetical protein
MNIAFLGNFRPRTALGEPFSTESHVAASYELLGHTVVRLQEDETRKADVPEVCARVNADLFHWTCTWHTDPEGGSAMLEGLRRLGIPSVGHTLDLFVGLGREGWLDADPWFRTDWFFSADGGHPEVFAAKGINHVWLPPAVYGPECYIADPDPALVQDVIFVGSYGYHPEWPYRKQLIDWLASTYGSRFTHYDHGSGMRGHRLNQLYASAKVVVGDSCCPGFRQRAYWSDRIPETLGRGGALVHPWIEGIKDHYTQGEHLSYYSFGDFDVLGFSIDSLLKWSTARDERRHTACEWVKTHHTYRHRAQTILECVQKGGGR